MNIQKRLVVLSRKGFYEKNTYTGRQSGYHTTGDAALAVTECASLFSTVTEADSRSELTRALLADPEAVAVIDYTLFDCTESQLSALKERFPRAPFILFCDSLNQELTRRLVFSQALFCMLPKDSS